MKALFPSLGELFPILFLADDRASNYDLLAVSAVVDVCLINHVTILARFDRNYLYLSNMIYYSHILLAVVIIIAEFKAVVLPQLFVS